MEIAIVRLNSITVAWHIRKTNEKKKLHHYRNISADRFISDWIPAHARRVEDYGKPERKQGA